MIPQNQGPHPDHPDQPHSAERAVDFPGESAGRSLTWMLILGMGLLAGLGAWSVGESFLDYFQPSEAASAQRNSFAALNRETARTNGLNGAVAFGSLGALLGLGLGLAGGISRRAVGWSLVGGLVGLVLGAPPARSRRWSSCPGNGTIGTTTPRWGHSSSPCSSIWASGADWA